MHVGDLCPAATSDFIGVVPTGDCRSAEAPASLSGVRYVPEGDIGLIALGSDGLTKAGYARVKHEVVTGPMPPFGSVIKTSDDLWRIIAFIRSVNPSSLKPAAAPAATRQ